MKSRRRELALMGAGLLIVAGCSTSAFALSENNVSSAATAPAACTQAQSVAALKYEQARILQELAPFRVLENPEKLAALAFPNAVTGVSYSILTHMYDPLGGMGFTVASLQGLSGGQPVAGQPTLLLYRPNPAARDVTDPSKPAFPYTLVGWGYTAPYDPGHTPTFGSDPGLKCIRPSQWLVHERGVHPGNTWQFMPLPPKESWHGQAAGQTIPTAAECHCVIGMTHPRVWDLHIFLGSNGIPTVSMFNPGTPIPGFNVGGGVAFFYPARTPAT
jgi:hypothetical protein